MNMSFHPDLQAMPLALAPEGATLEVRRLAGGEAFSQRMLSMGIGPGRMIRVVQREGGALVLAVGETRFGIGCGVAQKIMVVAVQENAEEAGA
ncbi:ferrous iron transport protein A [Rhodobacter aestuarii]|uniref:Fur family transcriptional regulator, ferric uptake regulator/ferrous iron transport protein A n=1 Tax=Rhodobacter aestuarii TaxID=453582 RepID=A0A1N7QHD2_9RHOB|nr:FeoA family protein [Rhodobacter aestuarii]PTV93355.1 ferrous iron transport protein A [Rhodobacter aestuarii]SIT22280.1 Fur family transcriptional regulator, ferric uptake regulator/ferrous iron transport protein A [Rhodobacter aestuarii]